jgi:hypothetical protein
VRLDYQGLTLGHAPAGPVEWNKSVTIRPQTDYQGLTLGHRFAAAAARSSGSCAPWVRNPIDICTQIAYAYILIVSRPEAPRAVALPAADARGP